MGDSISWFDDLGIPQIPNPKLSGLAKEDKKHQKIKNTTTSDID